MTSIVRQTLALVVSMQSKDTQTRSSRGREAGVHRSPLSQPPYVGCYVRLHRYAFAGAAIVAAMAGPTARAAESSLSNPPAGNSSGFDLPALGGAMRGSLLSVLRPAIDLSLSARAPGIVDAIHVPEGSEIKKNQVIIGLDADEERGDVAQAEASVRGTRAEMERAVAEFDRVQQLRSDNIFSEKQILDAKTQAELARSKYEQSTAALEIARSRLANRSIVSPIDGIFLKTNKSVGEAVERYETVVRVVDIRSLEMVVFCDARYFSLFQVDQQVQVKVLKSPEDQPIVPGVVIHTDPIVDPASGTFRVKIKLERSNQAIPGLTALLLAPTA